VIGYFWELKEFLFHPIVDKFHFWNIFLKLVGRQIPASVERKYQIGITDLNQFVFQINSFLSILLKLEQNKHK